MNQLVRHVFVLLVAMTPLWMWAQQTVKGVVNASETGEPLVGATVLVQGTQNGVLTDNAGAFSIAVPDANSTLIVSYLGYARQEIVLNGQSNITISMVSDQSTLDEVVVVGYATQKKVNLTGAVSVVNGGEISKRPVLQTSNALQGMSPGVTVRTFGGGPGDDGGEVRIRGLGTLNNNDPLVLIDGVVGSFTDVDPSNIESISILKDAASAAIYGSRASGGVVLITTKRGSDGFSVTYNGYAGIQVPVDQPEYLGPVEFLRLFNKASINSTGAPAYEDAFINSYLANNAADPDHFPITDWQKLAMRENPLQQQHSVSFNAGSDRSKILGTLLYMNQQGLLENSEFQRYGFRLNSDVKATDQISFFADLNLKFSDDYEPNGGEGSLFQSIARIYPTAPSIYSDGSWGQGWNGDNPVARARDGGVNNTKTNLAIINLGVNIEPVKGLVFTGSFAPRMQTDFQKNFRQRIAFLDVDSKDLITAAPATSYMYEAYNRALDIYLKGLVSYENHIGGLNYQAMLGYDQTLLRTDNFFASRDGFDFPDFQELNAGSEELRDNGGSAGELALRSYFGRVNFNLKERYLLEANFRYDGTSRFIGENQWGFFPSLSAGWRISEESFLKSVTWVNNLKLRASWGQLGNQNTSSRYPTVSSINLNQNVVLANNAFFGAASIAALSNPNLRWETTTQTDIGIDIGLFNSKLDIVFDYYIRDTRDILIDLPVPETSGFSSVVENAARVENKGWDFGIIYNNKIGDFRYSIGGNISDVRNRVLDLFNTGPYINGLQIIQEGEEMNSIFGYEAAGFFQTAEEITNHATQFGALVPGDIKYVDQNSDGIINAADRVIIGSRIPRYTYSSTIELGYKGFDLSIFLQGIGKYNGYQNSHAAWPFQNSGSAKAQVRHTDTWSPDNPDARYPNWYLNTTTNNYNTSSFWMTDASYLKVKNVVLGYNFPQAMLENTPINRARIYMSGQNVFSFDKMEGFDPESPLGDANFYPQVAVYAVGVNLTF
ncbi:MAG: TonB-dependent receptor [Bacteroidia bacterium]